MKPIDELIASICNNFKEVLTKSENEGILKFISDSEEHLNSLERFVRSQKYSIQIDIKQVLNEIQNTLELTQQNMFDRLDYFFDSYKQNFESLREIAVPFNLILKKFKYYSNFNNLMTKFGCCSSASRLNLVRQIKSSISIAKRFGSQDKIKQNDKILRICAQLNKALDQLPQYCNEQLNKTFEESVKSIQQFFSSSLKIPEFQIIEQMMPPIQQTQKKEQEPELEIPLMVQPFNHNEEESFQPTRVSVKDEDLMDMIYKKKNTEINSAALNDKQMEKIRIDFLQNQQLKDSRMIAHLNLNQIIQKPIGRKFKIKKKLTLDLQISAIALLSQNIMAIGCREGSLKLLDLNTNKVSFYPNAFITHFDEIICLQKLTSNMPQTKSQYSGGIRLASSSMDTNLIIWTLGENNIAYPERKLVGFERPITRMIDIEDGTHLAGVDNFGDLYIINYHDNRVPFSFKQKQSIRIIELIYSSQAQKLITISDSNLISIYNFTFKQMQIFSLASRIADTANKSAQLLANCLLESTNQGPNFGILTSCCALNSNDVLYLCYGNSDGSLVIFDVLKNTIIANNKLFDSCILDIAVFNTVQDQKYKKQGFLLVGIAQADTKIKAIFMSQEQKTSVFQAFGELIEECPNTQFKYIIQVQQKDNSDGRVSFITQSKNERDICLFDLI